MDTAKLSMEELRSQLLSLLGTLQTNREKVPLDILKTRYKKGSKVQVLRKSVTV